MLPEDTAAKGFVPPAQCLAWGWATRGLRDSPIDAQPGIPQAEAADFGPERAQSPAGSSSFWV